MPRTRTRTAEICDVDPADSLIASALADLVTTAVNAGKDGDGVGAVMARIRTTMQLIKAERLEAVVLALAAAGDADVDG